MVLTYIKPAARYPHLSSRPRTLYIDVNSIAKSLSRRIGSLGRIIPLIVNAVTRSKLKPLGTGHKMVAIALDAIPRITAATKLYIAYDYECTERYDPMILQVIRDVWENLGGQLRHLHASVTFENLELLFPKSLHLPFLEILEIETPSRQSKITTNFAEATLSAIQSISPCLRKVFFMTDALIDFEPVFRSLKYDMPHLRLVFVIVPFCNLCGHRDG